MQQAIIVQAIELENLKRDICSEIVSICKFQINRSTDLAVCYVADRRSMCFKPSDLIGFTTGHDQ